MPAFHLAFAAQPGAARERDVVVGAGADLAVPGPLSAPARILIAAGCADPQAFTLRAWPRLLAAPDPQAALLALAPEACLALFINPAALSLQARHTVPLHYLRLADATVQPLPAAPAAIHFSRGDTYLALSPGALRLAGSPAIARFIHLRDYFNAERLAAALLDHLLHPDDEVSAQPPPGGARAPEDITLLVLEAR